MHKLPGACRLWCCLDQDQWLGNALMGPGQLWSSRIVHESSASGVSQTMAIRALSLPASSLGARDDVRVIMPASLPVSGFVGQLRMKRGAQYLAGACNLLQIAPQVTKGVASQQVQAWLSHVLAAMKCACGG